MKYEGVIAILDGHPDITGDILGKEVTLPREMVQVTNGFSGPVIGEASVRIEDDKVIADIDIDTSTLPPEVVESFAGVIGGHITKRNGPVIEEWTLNDVGLTLNPCDRRLPNLKRKT